MNTMWRTAIPVALSILLPLTAQVRFKQEPDRILVDIDGKPYTTFYLAPGGNKPYLEVLLALCKVPESVVTFDKLLNVVPERRRPGIKAVRSRIAEVSSRWDFRAVI